MAKAATVADEPQVWVKTRVDGVVWLERAWPSGAALSVPTSVAERWRKLGWIPGLAMVRANQRRLVGNRVLEIGEVGPATSIAQARDLHERGVADWVNAAELGEQTPERAKEKAAKVLSGNLVRALKRLNLRNGSGLIEPGQTAALPVEEAIRICREGLAEPVGWSLPPVEKFRVRAIKKTIAAGRILNPGEEADVDADVASRLSGQGLVEGV
jgi:hypothetical protein